MVQQRDREWDTLRTSTGVPTGTLYGCISSLRSLVKRYDPSHVVWFWDHGRSSYRLSLDPEYKANRTKEPTKNIALKEEFRLVDAFLEHVGIVSYSEVNTEADDLIATAARRWASDDTQVLIVSGDHDVQQLVNKNVSIHKPSPRGGELLTLSTIQEMYGFDDPKTLVDLWSLMGDTGDGVKGVPRYGPKNSKKALDAYGSLQVVVDSKLSEENGKRALLNYELIRLDLDIAQLNLVKEDTVFSKTNYTQELTNFLQGYEMASLVQKSSTQQFWD